MPKKVTDATKAKLPLPKGHPQRKAVKRKPKRVRCPSCEKLVSADPTAVHSCYDAKGLLTPTEIRDGFGSEDAYRDTPAPRAIPCGEDVDANGVFRPKPNVLYYMGTFDMPERFDRASTPSGPQNGDSYQNPKGETCVFRDGHWLNLGVIADTPPDTSAYPWPVKAVNWLDAAPTKFSQSLAVQLRRLADWVAP